MKILVVAPHYDDAEFGCGGLLACAAEKGHEVTVLVMSVSDVKMANGKWAFISQRRGEGLDAAAVLGYQLIGGAALSENKFLEADYSEVVTRIERTLDALTPTHVFIPLPSYNQDHRVAYDAAVTALRPVRGFRGEVFAYEYPMQAWGPGMRPAGEFTGRVYFPYGSATWDVKKAALCCHKSQIEGRESTLTGIAGAHALARLRGLECGQAEYAELFVPLRRTLEL